MFVDTLPVDAVWSLLCAMSVAPVGFMLGSSCSPCCGGCSVSDGKPRTDPATEGHWVPSGTWASGVTWTFDTNPSTTDGGTWFFWGSYDTSKPGGGASTAEQQDWGNICNWYSSKTTTPSSISSLNVVLDKRATRLPPDDAIVHIYSSVNTTTTGPVVIKNAYFWYGAFTQASELTTTDSAHDSIGGCVFNGSSQNAASSIVNGGATFNNSSVNYSSATVNGGATFNGASTNNDYATVNGGATFNGFSRNVLGGTVNGGATFNDYSSNGSTYDFGSTVNGGATFNNYSANNATVNGGATFNFSSYNSNSATVNDGATFNDYAYNASGGTVNGGATFNDAACSRRTAILEGSLIFAVHPTDIPTCNGTAPTASTGASCGCG